MKRTLLSLVLTLALALGIFFALETPVSAATSGVTGSCTWQISGSTLTISGNGAMADYSDTNLPPWLESAPYITTIDVQEGVTSIGDYAFLYCTGVNSVLLPSYSLTRIGDGAFLMCENITSFWMPHTITQLGMAIFGGCNRMDSLSISTSNPVYTSAGNCIIEKATGTLVLGCTRSFIPQDAGIRAIGEGAFMMVYALGMADCTVPEGVTTIGEGAFAYAAVSHLPLPSTLKSIGVGAFLGTEVPFLEFPEGLKEIPAYCCSESTLQAVKLPSTLESIGEGAFSYCEKLMYLTLPQNLKTIGADAFWACDIRNPITFPNSVQTIGSSAFGANSALQGFKVEEMHPYFKSVGNCLVEKSSGILIAGCSSSIIPASAGIRSIGDYAFAYTNIQNVQIPEGVTGIGEGAFCGCESLNYVRFDGASVSVGHYAFADCLSISELALQKNPPTFQSTTFENTTVNAVWVEGATQQELNSSVLPAFASATWHYADNACDKTCNVCTATRSGTVSAHRYTDVCDPTCNYCGAERSDIHSYTNACDSDCDVCGETRQVEGHVYYNACDPDCNKCKEVRPVPDHVYDSACDEHCNECNRSRTAEADHSYPYDCTTPCTLCGECNAYHKTTVVTPANKIINDPTYPFVVDEDGWYVSTNKDHNSTSTLTVKATHHCGSFLVRYKVSSEQGGDIFSVNFYIPTTASGETEEKETSSVLTQGQVLTITYTKNGSVSSGEDCVRFKIFCRCEEDRCFASSSITPNCSTGNIVCDSCHKTIKEGPDHSFTSNCSAECTECTFIRTPPHGYDNACDTDCNACGTTREASHQYDDACDTNCNLCHTPRKAPHVYDSSDDLICNECSYERPPYTPGDVDENDEVELNDAIYLLYYVNFPKIYPIEQPVDFDGSGTVDLNDAIYLLYHVNFPDTYPLNVL